jgi:hypothetical protein
MDFTTWPEYEYSFARTSVGVGPNGVLFLVVADGEGVQGGAGATPKVLPHSVGGKGAVANDIMVTP